MGELVRRTVEDLNNARDIEDLKSCVWIASDLIRKAASSGYSSGFGEIDRESVSEAEEKELQQALLNALPRNKSPRYVAPILSALSSSRDASLLPLWIEHLAQHLELLKAANAVLYTTMTALNELGESVFDKNQRSRDVTNLEMNVNQASKYLHERGVTVPW